MPINARYDQNTINKIQNGTINHITVPQMPNPQNPTGGLNLSYGANTGANASPSLSVPTIPGAPSALGNISQLNPSDLGIKDVTSAQISQISPTGQHFVQDTSYGGNGKTPTDTQITTPTDTQITTTTEKKDEPIPPTPTDTRITTTTEKKDEPIPPTPTEEKKEDPIPPTPTEEKKDEPIPPAPTDEKKEETIPPTKSQLAEEYVPFDADGDGELSYEEWQAYEKDKQTKYWQKYAEDEKTAAEKAKENTYAAAAKARAEAEAAANLAHERAVVDANTAAAQNNASYGANAERLASMGLAGGGYSDYLNAQSYAQHRSDVQAANAEKTGAFRAAQSAESQMKLGADTTYEANVRDADRQASAGKLQADLTYAKNMMNYQQNEAEQEERNAQANIVANIGAGTYATVEDAVQAARDAGITDENILGQIRAQWTSYNNDKIAAENEKSYGVMAERIGLGDFATGEDFEAALSASGITDENTLARLRATYKAYENGVKDQAQAEAYGTISAEISAGIYGTKEELENALTGITDENAKRMLLAEWTVYDVAARDQKQADAYAVLSAEISAGTYKTRDEIEAAARKAGITDENLVALVGAEYAANALKGAKEQTSSFLSLYELVSNGSVNYDAIDSFAKQLGITDAGTIQTLKSLAGKVNSEKNAAEADAAAKEQLSTYLALYELAKSGDCSIAEIQDLAKQMGYEDKDGIKQLIGVAADTSAKIKEEKQEAYYNEIREAISAGYADLAEILYAKEHGQISQAQFDEIKGVLADKVPTGKEIFTDANGNYLSRAEAEKLLKEYKSFFGRVHSLSVALNNTFDDVYTAKAAGSLILNDSNDEWHANGWHEVELNGKSYDLNLEKKISDGDAFEALKNSAGDAYYVYGGRIYFKRANGEIWLYTTYGINDILKTLGIEV